MKEITVLAYKAKAIEAKTLKIIVATSIRNKATDTLNNSKSLFLLRYFNIKKLGVAKIKKLKIIDRSL